MSFSLGEGNSYEDYQQQIKQLNGKTAEEYKAQILARLPEFKNKSCSRKAALPIKR